MAMMRDSNALRDQPIPGRVMGHCAVQACYAMFVRLSGISHVSATD